MLVNCCVQLKTTKILQNSGNRFNVDACKFLTKSYFGKRARIIRLIAHPTTATTVAKTAKRSSSSELDWSASSSRDALQLTQGVMFIENF